MTSDSPGKEPPVTSSETSDSTGSKPPIAPDMINQIFASKEFGKLWESHDGDIGKVFSSSDSAAALFQSADFLKSLDAYKESLAKAPQPSSSNSNADENASKDPSSYFRSVDFLKSLDSLPKESPSRQSSSGVDYSSYFKSVDTLPKDFLKSLDSLPPKPAPAPVLSSVSRGGPRDMFTSRDWMGGYESGHVDVKYDKTLFQSGDSKAGDAARKPSGQDKWNNLYEATLKVSAESGDIKPPAAGSSWASMYESVLKNPTQSATTESAAAMPPLKGSPAIPAAAASATALEETTSDVAAGAKPKKKRVYKSRKVIPDVKTFVEYTDNDVLLGRGGLSNKHPGNKRYRQEIENAKAVYRSASKDEKTQWASLLVDYVKKYGGRFLEKDKETGQWYIVPDIVARRKAGQALREENTAESRAEKRERYKKKHGKS